MKKLVFLCVLGFSWVWFMPLEVGWRGESPVCKFRAQVFECDWHDYGKTSLYDRFLNPMPNKYGSMALYEKIGGWQEYFGLKEVKLYKYQDLKEKK